MSIDELNNQTPPYAGILGLLGVRVADALGVQLNKPMAPEETAGSEELAALASENMPYVASIGMVVSKLVDTMGIQLGGPVTYDDVAESVACHTAAPKTSSCQRDK